MAWHATPFPSGLLLNSVDAPQSAACFISVLDLLCEEHSYNATPYRWIFRCMINMPWTITILPNICRLQDLNPECQQRKATSAQGCYKISCVAILLYTIKTTCYCKLLRESYYKWVTQYCSSVPAFPLVSLTGSCKPHSFIFPFSDLSYCNPTHPAAEISTGIPGRCSSVPCAGSANGDKVDVLSSVKNCFQGIIASPVSLLV